MEKYITIPTSNGCEISWVLNWTSNTQKLIVMVHGLTWSMSEAHYYAAKEYFTQKWYAVFRFNLYGGREKNRQLHTTSIREHNVDVSVVLEYMNSQYSEIYLVWHSLAGPSIVSVENFPAHLQKIVFWDPAFDTSGTILRCFEKNGIWFFYPKNWKNIEISQEMYKEFIENNHMNQLQKINFTHTNMYIIFAGLCDKIHFKNQTDQMWIEWYVVEWANHGFTQEWKYEELFERTLEFIEK